MTYFEEVLRFRKQFGSDSSRWDKAIAKFKNYDGGDIEVTPDCFIDCVRRKTRFLFTEDTLANVLQMFETKSF